ncbi:flagellar filament capping protein FliD [Actinomarinicola tropica]|uniref:Flagellar hook-associated protein 2 n=1 Tax=Actinomarinicola tropica TaxID=2789776 RepID=A0A5Q2RKP9_9ACTN|nr:flagellar filament capping protein FliD [Actinomarinicola tropica]QGG94637.1 flagellar filament capping protein FliD [Actinomarinicola tropica]
MSYIDGIASGLNTTDIINQLMQVEAIPQTLLKNKATTVKAGLDAYAAIRTKFSSVRTAADALHSSSSWRGLAATSSNPDAVGVTARSGAAGGAATFSVVNLAQAMQRSSTDAFASTDAALDGRSLSITSGDHTFSSTATTLDELVAEINADGELGVTASTVQVRPGEHQLVLTAATSGVANGFTVADSGWTSGFAVTRTAEDAVLDYGGITVTRPTNTIDDLVGGVTLTLKAETTGPVTVNVARDADGITKKVKALVEAVNGALAEMKIRTAYDAETNQRSSLTGDATVRQLTGLLTGALADPVAASSLGSVGLAGVELTRDGKVTFDEAEFKAAYAADPAAVERLFVAGGTSTSADLAWTYAGWRAQPGTYAVEVTRTGADTYTATIDGETAAVTVNDDGSLKIAADSVHSRLGGLTVSLSTDATAALVEGVPSGVGSITYDPGAARRLSTVANRALDAVDGLLTSAEDARKARIDDINRQVEAWELRLEKRELGLRRQYTALETMMGQLANQGQWLAGQLGSLQANSPK